MRLKSFALAVAAVLNLAMQSTGNAAPGDTLYAKPGQLVSANGTRLNFYCMGQGSPAVVFDSGWEDWAPAWAVVQPQVAKWTRACSYDRAGAGFSEPGPMPRTSVRIADELHGALHNAGIDGPYILVGHAFGGDNVRTFAQRHLSDVAGLVLVEADASDVEPKEMQEEDHSGQPAAVAQLRKCGEAVAAGKPLPPLPTPSGQPARTCAQQFFRGLPESVWSPELNAAVLQLAQSKVALYDDYASEMEEMPRDERYLQENHRSLGARPVRIITSGNHGVGTLGRRPISLEHLKYQYEIALAQARWLDLSSNAKQIFTRNSSEYIQYDEPAVVVDAIREVFDFARLPSQSSPAALGHPERKGT
jgi:pimeloyl-ACP methyl ester carboxylesterase